MKSYNYDPFYYETLLKVGISGEIRLLITDNRQLRSVRDRFKSYISTILKEGKNIHGEIYDLAKKIKVKQEHNFVIVTTKNNLSEIGIEESIENEKLFLKLKQDKFDRDMKNINEILENSGIVIKKE
jgi:hypothetical protein